MALCFMITKNNGTRPCIRGIYPDRETAFLKLKEELASNVEYCCEDEKKAFDDVTSLEELKGYGHDVDIIEIADGGESLDIEIHGW